jgi:hypothetical protein
MAREGLLELVRPMMTQVEACAEATHHLEGLLQEAEPLVAKREVVTAQLILKGDLAAAT